MAGFLSTEGALLCAGKHYGPARPVSRRWRSDSRELCAGEGFVAIKGARTDGHLYLRQAVERGAELLLIDLDEIAAVDFSDPRFKDVSVIAVPNSQEALAALAEEYLRRVAPRVVAITGSVGKTTVRELTTAALAKRWRVHSAIRSFNTIIGCSLTVLAMAEDTEVLVLELGTNHFGEISEMVKRFPPEIAVITEAAPAHLEGFGSVEGVMRAKSEICESRALTEIVFNNDNKLIREYMSYNYDNVKKIPVGRGGGSEVAILNAWIELGPNGPRTSASYSDSNGEFTLACSLFGLQHASNMGYAFAVARALGVTKDETAAAFEEMPPISGRGLCRRCSANGWIIDEAYNANPASMSAAVKNTRAAAQRLGLKKCAVLGGMRELGSSAEEWHRLILAEIADFDDVLLLGEEWRFAEESLPSAARLCGSLDEILEIVGQRDLSESILLVKGSNSYGLRRVVEAFSD